MATNNPNDPPPPENPNDPPSDGNSGGDGDTSGDGDSGGDGDTSGDGNSGGDGDTSGDGDSEPEAEPEPEPKSYSDRDIGYEDPLSPAELEELSPSELAYHQSEERDRRYELLKAYKEANDLGPVIKGENFTDADLGHKESYTLAQIAGFNPRQLARHERYVEAEKRRRQQKLEAHLDKLAEEAEEAEAARAAQKLQDAKDLEAAETLATARNDALEKLNDAFNNAALLSEFDLPTEGQLLLVNGGRFTIECNDYYEEIAGDFSLTSYEKGEVVRGKKTAVYEGPVIRTIKGEPKFIPSVMKKLDRAFTQEVGKDFTITVTGQYKRTFLDEMWENSQQFLEMVIGSQTEVRGTAAVATSMLKTSLNVGPVLRAGGVVLTMGTFDVEAGIVDSWAVGFWFEKIGILIHQPKVWINQFGVETTNWEVIKTKTLSGGQVLQF